VFPYDPTRSDPKWLSFNARFETRFHEKPEQFASLTYDAMNALLDSICKAGLNRVRIHDALANIAEYDGVTGHMTFDPNQKNVEHMFLGTVHQGAISYRAATMEKATQNAQADEKPAASQVPYARVGEDGVQYAGPRQTNVPVSAAKVVLFGRHAEAVAQSAAMLGQFRDGGGQGMNWTLLPVASDQNWGAASTQLVHALMDEHALAIVALDRDAAHLAEQLALKAFVPVVALSEDKKLTSTNVPWIFRLPAATSPASAIGMLQSASTKSGMSPEKLRDVLASGQSIDGIAFLSTGEPKIQ
jgi:branched-chain amino acid transport system substrate-binding protein